MAAKQPSPRRKAKFEHQKAEREKRKAEESSSDSGKVVATTPEATGESDSKQGMMSFARQPASQSNSDSEKETQSQQKNDKKKRLSSSVEPRDQTIEKMNVPLVEADSKQLEKHSFRRKAKFELQKEEREKRKAEESSSDSGKVVATTPQATDKETPVPKQEAEEKKNDDAKLQTENSSVEPRDQTIEKMNVPLVEADFEQLEEPKIEPQKTDEATRFYAPPKLEQVPVREQQQVQIAGPESQVEGPGQRTVQTFAQIEEPKVRPKQKRRGSKKKRVSEQPEEEDSESKTKSKGKITFSDRLLRIALRYTSAPTRYITRKMPNLRDNLLRSNLRISPEGLIAISLLTTIISIPPVIFGVFELTRLGFVLEALCLPAVLVVPFLLGTMLPKVSASSRAQALDNELPYLIAYITVLAGGGISPITTLKRVSKAGKIFPAAAKEAARILMDIDIFGLDAISALERECRLTPNRMFSDFIGGYVAVLKTGGDAVSYLESKLKEIFSYQESKLKSSAEFIATMSEAYIITTVVMGVSLMVLWATQNLMSPNGMATTNSSVNSSMILMFSGLFVPVISLIFIIVIGSSQVREPFSYDLPYYIFLGCIPVGVLIYFLPLHLAVYWQLGIGLFVMSTPPMIVQMRYVKRKAAVEAKLSNFLRDISEIRKTGLAPEKTIEQIANRNYGGLSQHVKKIAAQLSWGTPMKTVLQTFINEVKSWVSRAVAFLLLEVVDVGGGSAKMFISLADFTEKNAQLEKERKAQIRPYIIIPYIGAILVVATTAMMVYYVSAPSAAGVSGISAYLPSPALVQKAMNVLLLGSFFQAWVMGFVAGKMGEGSAADGFKHATFLIIISMVTVVVSSFFIGGLA